MQDHRLTEFWHLRNAWKVCSGSLWQTGHKTDSAKHLFFLLGHVGSQLVATRHAKNLTLLDVMSCHGYGGVKKIGLFDESLDTPPSPTGATQ